MTTEARLTQASALRILAEISGRCQGVMYVRSGPQQLFERLELTTGKQFAHSWLYVPSQYLHLLRDQLANRDEKTDGPSWLDPISGEDAMLFPVACGNEVVAMLATPDRRSPQIDSEDKVSLATAFCALHTGQQVDVRQIATSFIRELFHRDSSVAQFTKRFFALLTSEWHRSCAGLYTERDGVYQLRLATGDVSRWFCLPRQLHPEATMQYLEAMYRQEFFVPADTVQEYPVFLDAPPDYLFVHEGILSQRSRQLILMAGPGTMATLGVNRILEYSKFLEVIHELQFANGLELLREFERIAAEGPVETDLESMLAERFTWVSQQMSVSRLAVVSKLGDGNWDHEKVIKQRQDGEIEVESHEKHCIPDEIMKHLTEGESYYVGDIRQSILTEQQTKERYLRNVISEMYLPLKTPNGVIGALVVGSGAAGDYLKDCDELLQSLAGYVSLWLQRSGARHDEQQDIKAGRTTAYHEQS